VLVGAEEDGGELLGGEGVAGGEPGAVLDVESCHVNVLRFPVGFDFFGG